MARPKTYRNKLEAERKTLRELSYAYDFVVIDTSITKRLHDPPREISETVRSDLRSTLKIRQNFVMVPDVKREILSWKRFNKNLIHSKTRSLSRLFGSNHRAYEIIERLIAISHQPINSTLNYDKSFPRSDISTIALALGLSNQYSVALATKDKNQKTLAFRLANEHHQGNFRHFLESPREKVDVYAFHPDKGNCLPYFNPFHTIN
jgi:hypothetical protein